MSARRARRSRERRAAVTTRDALWLIGDDIARSRSPAMHNAALALLGRTLRYSLRPTTRDQLDDVLAEAARACRGLNVTIPHKVEVFRRLEAHADDDARAVGAVNTVVYGDDGTVFATNTDVHGVLTAWRRAALHVVGRSIVVVGAGGAARAVVVAAARAKAASVHTVARNPVAARALHDLAVTQGLSILERPPERPAVVVVAIPVVDDPSDLVLRACLGPTTVHDLRVRPPTALRDVALARGHHTLDGSSMLLAQGERALEHFLGERLPDEVRRAMATALARST